MLTGKYTYHELRHLSQSPEYHWLSPAFESIARTSPDEALSSIDDREGREGIEDLRAVVILGSWCGDTRDHLPGFIQWWRELGGDTDAMDFIATDRSKTYIGWTDFFRVTQVPTFVVLRGDQELGRIVEAPEKSIREDLLSILNS